MQQQGYRTASEYIRKLIRLDQQNFMRQKLERDLLEGLASGHPEPITNEVWDEIRDEFRQRIASRQGNLSSGFVNNSSSRRF